jgi:cytoskeleton protein RodZ
MTYSDQNTTDGPSGCGAVLRQAREAAGLTIEQVATQLRMTVRSVANLESDDWSSLGAPVFVRGQLRSYARLLGVDLEPLMEHAGQQASPPPSTLVSHSHTPTYRRFAEHWGRRAIYVAITAAIVVPVWLGTRTHLNGGPVGVESLDVPLASTREADAPAGEVRQRIPVVASMASVPAATQPALSIGFTGESWFRAVAPDGRLIEEGVLGAGQKRTYAVGEVGQLVLGNVEAVEVKRAGAGVDLAPFSRANVARFTLSSDGSLAPVAH